MEYRNTHALERFLSPVTAPGETADRLNINVVFTSVNATLAALKAAGTEKGGSEAFCKLAAERISRDHLGSRARGDLVFRDTESASPVTLIMLNSIRKKLMPGEYEC